MRILLFGRLRDALGTGEMEKALPEGIRDAEGVRSWLGRDHPALLDPSIRVAVNAEIAHGNAAVGACDEIAFLPPMSGG